MPLVLTEFCVQAVSPPVQGNVIWYVATPGANEYATGVEATVVGCDGERLDAVTVDWTVASFAALAKRAKSPTSATMRAAPPASASRLPCAVRAVKNKMVSNTSR